MATSKASSSSSSESSAPDHLQDFDSYVAYALLHLKRSSLRLKPKQEAAIRAVFLGRDVFVWLPTGYGKSIMLSSTSLFV